MQPAAQPVGAVGAQPRLPVPGPLAAGHLTAADGGAAVAHHHPGVLWLWMWQVSFASSNCLTASSNKAHVFLVQTCHSCCSLSDRRGSGSSSCTRCLSLRALPVSLSTIIHHTIKQVHQGVLGFEMEQLLPPEIGASLADLQQQQAAGDSADDLSDAGSSAGGSASDLASQLRGGPASAQLGERVRYKEAAERIRGAVAAGRQELRNKVGWDFGGRGRLLWASCLIGARRFLQAQNTVHSDRHSVC